MDEIMDVQKELDEALGSLFLVRGKRDEKVFWALLSVKPSLMETFYDLHNTGKPYDMTEYGDVLHYGEGDTPTEKDWDYMKENFGAQENLEELMQKSMQDAVDFATSRVHEDS